MELSIIIVNWNALDYLRACIESIYQNTSGVHFEIIIVDNASTKGDVDSLKFAFPEIVLIKSSENLGFASANNLGCQNAKGTFVLFLNPDTKLVGPAINILLNGIKSLPDAGIVGCKQVNPDLTVQTCSIQKFPTIVNQILNIEYLRVRWPDWSLWGLGPLFRENSVPVEVEVIPGACILLRRELFEQVGMFSNDYFMYAEDIDLNYKIAKTGCKNYYIPNAVIIHYGGVSSSQKNINNWSIMMKYRAMNLYYAKYYSCYYALFYRIVIGFTAFSRIILITLAYPLGNIFWSKKALRIALQKWGAVLIWSLGFADRSLNVSINQ